MITRSNRLGFPNIMVRPYCNGDDLFNFRRYFTDRGYYNSCITNSENVH